MTEKMSDKRLAMEIEALRQTLWRGIDGRLVDPRLLEAKPEQTTDRCRWIDTNVMLADPLTKAMDAEKLVYVVDRVVRTPS